MSNSLDLDQALHFVGPDLGPKCLQRLPADGTKRVQIFGEVYALLIEICILISRCFLCVISSIKFTSNLEYDIQSKYKIFSKILKINLEIMIDSKFNYFFMISLKYLNAAIK